MMSQPREAPPRGTIYRRIGPARPWRRWFPPGSRRARYLRVVLAGVAVLALIVVLWCAGVAVFRLVQGG